MVMPAFPLGMPMSAFTCLNLSTASWLWLQFYFPFMHTLGGRRGWQDDTGSWGPTAHAENRLSSCLLTLACPDAGIHAMNQLFCLSPAQIALIAKFDILKATFWMNIPLNNVFQWLSVLCVFHLACHSILLCPDHWNMEALSSVFVQ